MNTKTEFKNVYYYSRHNKYYGYRYSITRGGFRFDAHGFKTARSCAIALDRKLIENFFEPINILKRIK